MSSIQCQKQDIKGSFQRYSIKLQILHKPHSCYETELKILMPELIPIKFELIPDEKHNDT